jgi:hypothetical protein
LKVKENKHIIYGDIKPSVISYPSKIIGTFPGLSFTIIFKWDHDISGFLVKFNDNKEILIDFKTKLYDDKETVNIYTNFFKMLNSRLEMLPTGIDPYLNFQFE